MFKTFIYSVLFIFVISTSCVDPIVDEKIPYSYVDMNLNLNLIQYQNLRNLGGYVYIPPGDNSGYKGIIVYHEGSGVYKAFERACTYDPFSDCDPVEVDDSGIFMIHKCCDSSFNFNGNPTSGPASLDLLRYRTFVDGIYLKIISE